MPEKINIVTSYLIERNSTIQGTRARVMNFASGENNFVRKGVIQGGQIRQNLTILFAEDISRATL